MRPARPPQCGGPSPQDAFVHVGEIEARAECYRGAEEVVRRRLGALQQAVRKRERAASNLGS